MHAQFGIVLHSSGPLCFVGIFTDFSLEFFCRNRRRSRHGATDEGKDEERWSGLVFEQKCWFWRYMQLCLHSCAGTFMENDGVLSSKWNFDAKPRARILVSKRRFIAVYRVKSLLPQSGAPCKLGQGTVHNIAIPFPFCLSLFPSLFCSRYSFFLFSTFRFPLLG